MSVSRKTVLIILAFFAIYIIWGSTYLLNKISVSQLPPFFLASVRFLFASMIIFIIAKSLGISLSISKKQLLNTGIELNNRPYQLDVLFSIFKYVTTGIHNIKLYAVRDPSQTTYAQ